MKKAVVGLPGGLAAFHIVLVPFFMFFLLTPYFRKCNGCVTLIVFVITDLASFLSKGVTEGCGLMAGFKGFVSPLTSGLLIYSTLVYLVTLSEVPT